MVPEHQEPELREATMNRRTPEGASRVPAEATDTARTPGAARLIWRSSGELLTARTPARWSYLRFAFPFPPQAAFILIASFFGLPF